MKPKTGSEFLGTTSFPNVRVAERPGNREKVQTGNPIFKGLKSPSVVLKFTLAVGGAREGWPRSEEARSPRFG